jgi:phospholipid/cholesterol/gamma-HCH transport system substrate-binding protein
LKEIITPFKVGVVVLAGAVAFVWMVGQVRKGIDEDTTGYRVFAIFDDVGGLAEKSRVTIAGINVGQIDTIELAGTRARVWLRVNTPLRSDARVAKRQASLLGDYYLQLTPGYTGDPLQDGDQIAHVDYDVAAADLLNDLKKISADVSEVTETLRRVVSGNEGEQKLVTIFENINKIVADVQRTVGDNAPKIDGMVDNIVAITTQARAFTADFRDNAHEILVAARAVTENVRAIVGENTENVQEGFEGVKGAVHRLQRALDELETTLAKSRSIASKIDRGEGTLGKLVNDDQLADNMNALLEESGKFIRQYTRMQTIVAMRSDFYVGRGAVRNAMEVRLQPRPDKYYSLQLIDDPRGAINFRETVTNSSASTADPIIREQETITEDRFRLSLLFAKRFYWATGRVGIIENSGGLGLDLHFLRDDLELSADLFAFDDNVSPRMRLSGLYTFFSHLYFAAGVDEVFNDELTDFFVGLGLRFNDEDLKALMTAAPIPSF